MLVCGHYLNSWTTNRYIAKIDTPSWNLKYLIQISRNVSLHHPFVIQFPHCVPQYSYCTVLIADMWLYNLPPYFQIINISLCTHYSGEMTCLITIVTSSSSYEQRELSGNSKWKSAGNQTSNPLLSSAPL